MRLPDAVDGTTYRLATTGIFCYYKSNIDRELAKEQYNIIFNIIFLGGKRLNPLLYVFVSARWVSRYAGMDVRS
jgi:hypothetical protein